MKLDAIDKKLLRSIYHNCRNPITQIAKACRISRDQAEYRLKKFESKGLIKKYLTIFNYSLLGYNEFAIVWLKLSSKKESLKKELEKNPNVISTGEFLSNYDLFINFIFKDKQDFEDNFNKLLENNREIINYSIFSTTYSEFYPLKDFGELKEAREYNFTEPSKKVEISQKDLSIMGELEKNGRIKISDLAGKIDISGELLAYKLKQLRKRKIILGNRVQFDMEKLGFNFATLRLRLSHLEKEKIKSFCKNHKHINALAFGISNYNCIVQFFYQEEKELRDSLRDLNNIFQGIIQRSELLLIEKEGRARTLPF